MRSSDGPGGERDTSGQRVTGPVDRPGPSRVRLDASTTCQLKCPLCSTGQKRAGVGWGHLTFRDFKEFVDDNPSIESIELSNYGEVFLDPEISDIFRYAYERGVALTIETGANLNTLRLADAENLVRYRVKSLTVALDGATPETYKLYRHGGDFDRVIANVRLINQFKKQYGSLEPEITWQFVIFGHNEHELPLARRMAEELGMDLRARLSWDSEWSPVRDREFVRKMSGLGAATREEYRDIHGKEFVSPCLMLWNEPVINWDGRMLGCCVNRNFGDFGNVFSSNLQDVLYGELYEYTKEMLQGHQPARADVPCTNCSRYQEMNRAQQWLNVEFIDDKPA